MTIQDQRPESWTGLSLETVFEQIPSRVEPTGYGPFWPALLYRAFLGWRQRRTGSARLPVVVLSTWRGQESVEERDTNVGN